MVAILNDGFNVERCFACNYTHKTYFGTPAKEDVDDDVEVFNHGEKPFIKLQVLPELDSSSNKKYTILACPRCGVLQVERLVNIDGTDVFTD